MLKLKCGPFLLMKGQRETRITIQEEIKTKRMMMFGVAVS